MEFDSVPFRAPPNESMYTQQPVATHPSAMTLKRIRLKVAIPASELGSCATNYSPVSSTAMNAFCGMLTEPIDFIFCLPFFWASSSLRLRLTSPP